MIDLQHVDARLWQDPFAAADRHEEELQSGSAPLPGLFHSSGALRQEIERRRLDSQRITILAAMVFGGPYVEIAEHRRRIRYATISALGVSCFVPKDGEHIAYFVRDPIASGGEARRYSGIVPYEWFGSEHQAGRRLPCPPAKHRVLLLWLNEDLFASEPLARIAQVLGSVTSAEWFETPTPDSPKPPAIDFTLIGPDGSTTLHEMVREVRDESGNSATRTWLPKQTRIYSAAATADGGTLADRPEDVLRDKVGIRLVRTIATDRAVIDQLLAELRLRGVVPWPTPRRDPTSLWRRDPTSLWGHASPPDHIALVSEWDSLYGRTMPQALAEVACQNAGPLRTVCEKSVDDPQTIWIHRFVYLRGLDGVVAKPPGSRGSEAQPKNSQAKDGEEDRNERAESGSQLDYLRRLADRIVATDEELRRTGGAGIKAVGVLGTDFYDKLLVLKALRQSLAQAVFFTTDMDARWLHRRDFDSSRNLIVGSAFGLRLTDRLQGGIPPFRDSYQTSVFYATLRAFGRVEDTGGAPPPRVFEIGRNVALDLSRQDANPAGAVAIHPHPDSLIRWPSWHHVLLSVWASLLGGALLYLWSETAREGLIWLCDRSRAACQRWPPAIVLGALGGVTLVYLLVGEGANGEPFRLFEGISMWPTEIIRMAAALLSAVFLLLSMRTVTTTTDWLRTYFVPEGNRAAPPGRAGPAVRDTPPHPDGTTWIDTISAPRRRHEALGAEQMWQGYRSDIARQWRRVLVNCGVFYVFGIVLVLLFRWPHKPYRGEAIWWIDQIVLLVVSIPLFLVLLFYVIDVIRLCDVYTHQLGLPDKTHWPLATRRRLTSDHGNDFEFVDHWIDVKVIGEWTARIGSLIYYPFVIIFLFLLARNAIFDDFDLPIGLALMFALSLALALYCALALRRIAQRGRQAAVDQLTANLIKLKGDPQASKEAIAQCEMLIKEAGANREGALGSFLEQDFVKALLLPIGATGITLLQYFLLGR